MSARKRDKAFILYDQRGIQNPDDAAVLVSCNSLSEAWSYLRRDFGDGAIYEYDITPDSKLVNEALVGWRENGKEWRA